MSVRLLQDNDSSSCSLGYDVTLEHLESEILRRTLAAYSRSERQNIAVEGATFNIAGPSLQSLQEKSSEFDSATWDPTKDGSTAEQWHDCTHLFDSPIKHANPVTISALFMVVSINIMGGASRPLCNFILNCCVRILSLTMRGGHKGTASSLTAFEERLLKEFPRDLRQVRNIFRLEPKITTYATCPKCCCLYPPTFCTATGVPKYPATCTWRYPRYKKEQTCGQVLVEFGAGRPFSVDKPIRPFAYRPLPDFISHLLSRPEVEAHLEQPLSTEAPTRVLEDLSHSPLILEALRQHQGHCKVPAADRPLYLVWGLCVDWFNPYGNKIAGAKQSVGMMALVCYNLPPDIRYRTENMHLCGVIPGPREPSREQMNHFLAPLTDDFLRMWDPGVFFSRTAKYKQGRRVFSLAVPLISDAPASKKISGMASHSANIFCSLCRLPRADINNLDEESWERITPEQHRQLAEQWRQAESRAEQDRLLKQHGIRWSELLRLPYWDPTRYIIIDPMHNLLLGLIQFHCRTVLGFDVRQSSSDDSSSFQGRWTEGVDEGKVAEGRLLLAERSPTMSKLKSLKLPNLLFLCRERHLWAIPGGNNGKLKIKDLIEALLEPKASIRIPRNLWSGTLSDVDPTTLLTSEVLNKIRRDIDTHLRPSWMKSLPRTFGSSSHGKLKADQWRTAMEFDLPMSLIEVWALRDGSNQQALVDITMDLVLALRSATSPQITALHVSKYMHHIKRYLQGLRRSFPWIRLRPNHHYALHLGELIQRFGPVRSWWTFPFERVVGVLQQVQTNSKPGMQAPFKAPNALAPCHILLTRFTGHLEVTMMNTFCMAGSLRGLLSSSACPTILSESQQLVDQYLIHFRELESEPRVTASSYKESTGKGRMKKLDDRVYHALLSHFPLGSAVGPYVYPLHHIVMNGVQYTTARRSRRDSQVFFHSASDNVYAGYIQEIFCYAQACSDLDARGSEISGIFVAICPYREAVIPLSENPYTRYPDFKVLVCNKPRQGDLHVVPSQNVVCHAGLHKTDSGYFVLKSLERYMKTGAAV
ncbi:hypothetical protein NM688_g6997 [Phlebia brevispora]|uniref:Uncharacterized protein n=1 Tax=Phlebia brevispora TaxID=194682 RepID=A0ACC1SAD5_9APHY|nr:hypothetical protein NM688_g6997 [Phlebia brevispora]